jgi:hypothetical protein
MFLEQIHKGEDGGYFLWNLHGVLWTHENKPELIDLPFATAEERTQCT